MRLSRLAAITLLLALAQAATAQTTPLRVLASNGMKAVIEELRPSLEKDLGRPLAIQFGTSAATRERIVKGEEFDVAVLTTEILMDLQLTGNIARDSIADLGRSGIGFGVREGATKPDIRTPEAVKQTLIDSKSLTWVSVGASRAHIDRMVEGLGITPQVKAKTVLTQGVDESIQQVADGKVEMIITLTSEILPAKGIQYVGPLPPQFQNRVSFSAGVSRKSSASAASAFLIRLLRAPANAAVYEAKGMELPAMKDVRTLPIK